MELIKKHFKQLAALKEWPNRLLEALNLMEQQRQTGFMLNDRVVDEQLYDGFFSKQDQKLLDELHKADPNSLSELGDRLKDPRLRALLPLYKARNFSDILDDNERQLWEDYRTKRLLGGGNKSRAARFFTRLSELANKPNLTSHDQYLLEELQLYAQSILPIDAY